MLKILIIEDDEITNFIIAANLKKFGFEDVSFALNGQEGIDYLSNHKSPDIILLDLNMPILDGWEFLEMQNSLDLCKNVPIIITTSSARPEDRLKAVNYLNIIDYMEKPLDFKSLSDSLMKIKNTTALL